MTPVVRYDMNEMPKFKHDNCTRIKDELCCIGRSHKIRKEGKMTSFCIFCAVRGGYREKCDCYSEVVV